MSSWAAQLSKKEKHCRFGWFIVFMFDLHGATLLVPKLFTIYDLLFDDVRKSYFVLWNCHESENISKIAENDLLIKRKVYSVVVITKKSDVSNKTSGRLKCWNISENVSMLLLSFEVICLLFVSAKACAVFLSADRNDSCAKKILWPQPIFIID